MSHLARRRVLIPGLGLAVAAAVAVPAIAGVTEHETQLFLANSAPAFHGIVHSDVAFCENHRRVRMFRQRPGDDRLLGTDRSDNEGRWEVDHPSLRSGAYYARVARKEQIVSGDGLLCKADKSRVIVVD